MKAVKRVTLVMTVLLGAAPAALAQSAYTSGTIASRLAAGYPSPYGNESGLYDYAPESGVQKGCGIRAAHGQLQREGTMASHRFMTTFRPVR